MYIITPLRVVKTSFDQPRIIFVLTSVEDVNPPPHPVEQITTKTALIRTKLSNRNYLFTRRRIYCTRNRETYLTDLRMSLMLTNRGKTFLRRHRALSRLLWHRGRGVDTKLCKLILRVRAGKHNARCNHALARTHAPLTVRLSPLMDHTVFQTEILIYGLSLKIVSQIKEHHKDGFLSQWQIKDWLKCGGGGLPGDLVGMDLYSLCSYSNYIRFRHYLIHV